MRGYSFGFNVNNKQTHSGAMHTEALCRTVLFYYITLTFLYDIWWVNSVAAGQLSYGGNEPEKWKRGCNVIKLINSIYFSYAKGSQQGWISPCLAETHQRWAGERSQ